MGRTRLGSLTKTVTKNKLTSERLRSRAQQKFYDMVEKESK